MDQKNKSDKFPGYPHYPANEDITNAKNNNGAEQFGDDKPSPKRQFNDTVDEQDVETNIFQGTDADLTPEDIRALESSGQDMGTPDSNSLQFASLDNTDDDGDPLNEESSLNMDMTGEDLDVPGSSADDSDEEIGEEDEENNYYSLGGDDHEAQEERQGD